VCVFLDSAVSLPRPRSFDAASKHSLTLVVPFPSDMCVCACVCVRVCVDILTVSLLRFQSLYHGHARSMLLQNTLFRSPPPICARVCVRACVCGHTHRLPPSFSVSLPRPRSLDAASKHVVPLRWRRHRLDQQEASHRGRKVPPAPLGTHTDHRRGCNSSRPCSLLLARTPSLDQNRRIQYCTRSVSSEMLKLQASPLGTHADHRRGCILLVVV